LALFGHKITLYGFNQGLICRGLKSEQGAEPLPPRPLTLTTAYKSYIVRIWTMDNGKGLGNDSFPYQMTFIDNDTEARAQK